MAEKKVTVGTVLHGYCNGYFGRDSYGDKRIVAMGKEDGLRWIVAKEDGVQHPQFAWGFDKKQLQEWTEEAPDWEEELLA